jgi:hypothetical protein
VCHNRRSNRHKVFDGYATRGKSSMGWYFGFKLHLMVNDEGELLAFRVTTGEVDDREPVWRMAQELWGISTAIAATFPRPSTTPCWPLA